MTEINLHKRQQVYELLLTPIVCCEKIRHNHVSKEEGIIYSGQKYYSTCDEDMSDFSVGFYEILYRDIIPNSHLLNESGRPICAEFVGDTMSSFNTIANFTPGAGKSRGLRTPEKEWPESLRQYFYSYHCLANFWLLPCDIGRSNGGKLNKATRAKDYMDRFLELVYAEVKFDGTDGAYFNSFCNWEDFLKRHYLNGSFVKDNGSITKYSDKKDSEKIICCMKKIVNKRAVAISESKAIMESLWNYFKKNGLIE